MDAAIALPDFLSKRPLDEPANSIAEGLIFQFDCDKQSAPECPDFQGVRVISNFVSESEADDLMAEIARSELIPAQSGKLKQHFGPKINFNKKKLNATSFHGLPSYAHRIESRMRKLVERDIAADAALIGALEHFETTNLFVLRYSELDQSNLDFHCDDTFAYDELIIDLSLESESVLSFIRKSHGAQTPRQLDCVRVPMAARSMVMIYGSARFAWEHAVLAYDITEQRTSITQRSLHRNLRKTEAGQRVVEIARRSGI